MQLNSTVMPDFISSNAPLFAFRVLFTISDGSSIEYPRCDTKRMQAARDGGSKIGRVDFARLWKVNKPVGIDYSELVKVCNLLWKAI